MDIRGGQKKVPERTKKSSFFAYSVNVYYARCKIKFSSDRNKSKIA
jgi:hypothetical protein